MELPEYDVWYEVWGFDGVGWEFITDHDTREGAEYFIHAFEVPGYEQLRIKKGRGLK